MNFKHRAKIEKCKLVMMDKEAFNRDIEKYNGQEVFVSISKLKNKRSIYENQYYWGVVVNMIADETGQESDQVHEFLKWKFLKKIVVLPKLEIETVGSTTELSTIEFEHYLEQCRSWASEFLNLYIPNPNEYN